ncbi:hypothetical protein TNCV_686761 [Trichonephila clavipes]|nr:hypothetical protein TNCV_686761 [Trichonephila clavipes]
MRRLEEMVLNTFSHDDIDELLVDDALEVNDIIDLTFRSNCRRRRGSRSKLENHFLINDPNSEREPLNYKCEAAELHVLIL